MPQGCGAATTPSGGIDELHRRALRLHHQVARILRGQRDLVLAVHQAVELLDVGVERVRLQRRELRPEVVAVELPQHVPLDVLQSGYRHLDRDRVGPFRIEHVLPGLRRLFARHEIGVVGDCRHHQRAPGPIALGRAFVFGLVGRHFRRHVLHVAAALLEIEREAHVGKLRDIGEIDVALAFGQQPGIERAGLEPQIVRPDLREQRVELCQFLLGCCLGIGGVDHERAFLLGLGDVGAGLEAVHLARIVAGDAPPEPMPIEQHVSEEHGLTTSSEQPQSHRWPPCRSACRESEHSEAAWQRNQRSIAARTSLRTRWFSESPI